MKNLKIMLRALLVSVDFVVFLPLRILWLIIVLAYAKLKGHFKWNETLEYVRYGFTHQFKNNIKWIKDGGDYELFNPRES